MNILTEKTLYLKQEGEVGMVLSNPISSQRVKEIGTCPVYVSNITPIHNGITKKFRKGAIVIAPSFYYLKFPSQREFFKDGEIVMLSEEGDIYPLEEKITSAQIEEGDIIESLLLERKQLEKEIETLAICLQEDYYQSDLGDYGVLESTLDNFVASKGKVLSKELNKTVISGKY